MAKSSIADRYLKTLEDNALESRGPPMSIKKNNENPDQIKSVQSPVKSALKNSPVKKGDAIEFQQYKFSPKRPLDPKKTATFADSPKQPTPTLKPAASIPSSKSFTTTPSTTSASSAVAKSVSTLSIKSTPLSALTSKQAMPKSASALIAQKPDRHLLMHNQDLTPSQVSWDSERKNWQAYEYLCHVVEAKEWMEKILDEKLPPAEQFPESLQNGIFLAKIVQRLKPELMKWPVFEHKRLQYRHTENITLFFNLLGSLNIPQLFLFDMTDLYEKRNLPKVIYCIHAVSHFIAESDFAVSAVDNLVGKLEFSDDQLLTTEKGLQGRSMPNFGAMTRQLSGKQPKLQIDDQEDIEYDPVKEKELEERPQKEQNTEDEMGSPGKRPVKTLNKKSYAKPEQVYSDTDYTEGEITEDDYSEQYYTEGDYSAGDVTLDDLTEARARRRSTNQYDYSDSDSSSINIVPPRRRKQYNSFRRTRESPRQNSYYYNERYSRYDSRQYREMNYRNFSSTGSFRSKILSAAELMLMELEELEPEIALFQGICRRVLYKKQQRANESHPETVQLITTLQAISRGKLYRRSDVSLAKKPQLTETELARLVTLQAIIRAQQFRKHFRQTAGKVNGIVDFQSLARGVLARRPHANMLTQMRGPETVRLVTGLQSGFRGVLLRFKLGCLYDELLEVGLPTTVKLQAYARGALIRKSVRRAVSSWSDNLDKVILLQSIWRAKTQGSRYSSLLSDSNPSLTTLKPFLHLYEENDNDYQSEVELEGIMREISKHMKDNEGLQSRIDQLDMKIALLVKNDIIIDELLLQQQKQNEALRTQLLQEKHIDEEFGSLKPNNRGDTSGAGVLTGLKDQFDIKLLQKASRERFELYQGLLYILQTQPMYVFKLMSHNPPRSLDMAQLVMSIYGNAKSKREQFYLLKQLASSITQSTVGSAENTVAWRIVSQLNRSKESAEIARTILEPGTEKLKALSEQVLEYDPHLIYENLTGGGNMNAEEAIQDPAVRALFVQNLRWLRVVASSIVQSLAVNVEKLPYHLKLLAREVYREILRSTNDREEAMSAVGQIIISQYLEPALLAADSLDLVDAAVGNTAKNLALVGRVLHQVGVMLPFDTAGSTDIYLRPLNEFVKSSAHQISVGFQSAVVQCADLHAHFNMSEFDDITMHDRPALYVTMDNLLALHYMCYNNLSSMAPSNDNTLKPLVQQLGPLPKDSREMLDLARFKDVKLELNPKYCSSSLNISTSESSSLLATTKRCLVYVLRIQNSQPDLMSVLVNPVEVEDEVRYNMMLDTDNNRELAGELANLTFRELKLLTLEKVLELESSGAVSRENDYQTLINSIANDIRNKDVVRQRKSMNVTNKKRNLRSLEEKGVYLKQRLESYSKHIDDALESLLTEAHQQQINASGSKRFQKFQIHTAIGGGPSSSGLGSDGSPRFGAYKTTAEKLYEKGVLMRLQGYTERQRRDVNVTISCDKVVIFRIDVTYKGILLPNGQIEISLDDLLAHQYQNEQNLGFINGQLQFNTNRLMQLILAKFMTIQK